MKVLMVEDEKRLSEAVAQILQKNRYFVDLVFDGEDGLNYALTGTYDIIILDIMLPKQDGISILRELRNNRVQTPVILLTAKGEIEDKILGLDSGADDYLAKPFAMGELLARLRALGRRQESILPDNGLSMGNVALQPATMLLSSVQDSVTLTAKEYQIMELLFRRKNIITPKEMVIEKVWGYDTEIDEHSVETYISFLRKKLTLIHANISIQAIRGAGYIVKESGELDCSKN